MNYHYNDEYECELLKPYSGLDKPINHGKIELLTKPGHPYPLLSFLDGDQIIGLDNSVSPNVFNDNQYNAGKRKTRKTRKTKSGSGNGDKKTKLTWLASS